MASTSVMMPKNGRAAMYTSGWPKNQNRCCQMIGSPPPAGSNTWAPRLRSASIITEAEVSTGKAISTSTLVTSMFQVKIGIRNIDMPGARMANVVAMTLTAPVMVAVPVSTIDSSHRSWPMAGLRMASDSGA